MRRGVVDPRFAALLALGALSLHQLRYLLAHGGDAGAALAREGHAYLEVAVGPLLTVAGAALALSLLAPLFATGGGSGRSGLARRAAAFTLALLALFVAQELVEGALFPGHAPGLAAVLGSGGWLSIPLALAIGALLAALAALLDRAELAVAGLVAVRRCRTRPRAERSPAPRPSAPTLSHLLLAFGFARRPPPRSLA